jgi:hypothetical protein
VIDYHPLTRYSGGKVALAKFACPPAVARRTESPASSSVVHGTESPAKLDAGSAVIEHDLGALHCRQARVPAATTEASAECGAISVRPGANALKFCSWQNGAYDEASRRFDQRVAVPDCGHASASVRGTEGNGSRHRN